MKSIKLLSLFIGIFIILYIGGYNGLLISKQSSSFSTLNRRGKGLNHDNFILYAASKKRTILNKLDDVCHICIRASKQHFNSGSEYYSNPKSQMGSWIDENYKNDIIEIFDDICMNQTSELYKNTLRNFADFPFCTDIFHSNSQYSLTLFHLPSYTSVPKYSHEAGTFLAYKTLYGESTLQTHFSSAANRIDTILNSESVAVRIGGPSRSYINNASSVCGVLELAIYPPIVKLEGTFDEEVKTPSLLNPSELAFNLLAQPYVTIHNDPIIPGNIDITDDDTTATTARSNNHESMYVNELFPAVLFQEQSIATLFASFNELQEEIVALNKRLTGQKDSNIKSKISHSPSQSSPSSNIYTNIYKNEDIPNKPNQSQKFNNTASDPFKDIPGYLKQSIGGLDTQLGNIARRLLYSRRLPLDALEALGITHVSGLLLYGPPGTGKTLLARQLSYILTPIAPKIVNGPEILDKFVGEAERNIRLLFQEADDEWDRRGYESNLHVIVFDEVCKHYIY